MNGPVLVVELYLRELNYWSCVNVTGATNVFIFEKFPDVQIEYSEKGLFCIKVFNNKL